MHGKSLWPGRPVSSEGFFRRELVEWGTHSARMAYCHGTRMPFPGKVPQALHYRQCKWYNSELGLKLHYTSLSPGEWYRGKMRPSQVQLAAQQLTSDLALWHWQSGTGYYPSYLLRRMNWGTSHTQVMVPRKITLERICLELESSASAHSGASNQLPGANKKNS